MKKIVLIFFLLNLNCIYADEDPCLKDYKSKECQKFISETIFFYRGNPYEKAVQTPEEQKKLKVIQNFLNTHGVDGFVVANENRETLFEEVFISFRTNLDFLKEEILEGWKKDTLIRNKNIYQVLITQPMSSEQTLNNLVFGINKLFPEEGNSNLELTHQKFGLPWDDKDFMEGYINLLKETVERIDRNNEFFKKNDFLGQKEQISKIIERLEPLSKIHTKICDAKIQQEIEDAKVKLPGIFKSSHKDVISCLLKNNQCGLVEGLIKSGEYPLDKLKTYFNEIYYKDDTKNCANAMKFTYLEMLKNGIKPAKYYFQQERILLFNLSDYINKYALSLEPFCAAPVGKERHTIDDIDHSMMRVMQAHSFDILGKIRAEKDPKLKDELITQLKASLDLIPYNGAGKDPQTGKTILMTLAKDGDLDTFNLLVDKGMGPLELGYIDDMLTEEDVFHQTIRSGELAQLKFASRVYDLLESDDHVVFSVQHLLKKLHPKDEETKAYRKEFKEKVDERERMIY